MVKNANGGKHKNVARKVLNRNASNLHDKKTTLSQNEFEVYAQVVRMLGGSACEVILEDGRKMLCMLGGRFTGKNKRSNRVEKGTFVLVQLREWERRGEEKKVDLLVIYAAYDVEYLQRLNPVFFRNDGLVHGVVEERGAVSGSSTSKDDDFVIFSSSAKLEEEEEEEEEEKEVDEKSKSALPRKGATAAAAAAAAAAKKKKKGEEEEEKGFDSAIPDFDLI